MEYVDYIGEYEGKKTPIQRQIEAAVTSGRGYDRKNTARTPWRFMNNEIGLQIALANMDNKDGKLDIYQALDFSSRLDRMVRKFDGAGIPLSVISDANSFGKAIFSAYALNSSNSEDLIPKEDSFDRLIKIKILPNEYFKLKYEDPTGLLKSLRMKNEDEVRAWAKRQQDKEENYEKILSKYIDYRIPPKNSLPPIKKK